MAITRNQINCVVRTAVRQAICYSATQGFIPEEAIGINVKGVEVSIPTFSDLTQATKADIINATAKCVVDNLTELGLKVNGEFCSSILLRYLGPRALSFSVDQVSKYITSSQYIRRKLLSARFANFGRVARVKYHKTSTCFGVTGNYSVRSTKSDTKVFVEALVRDLPELLAIESRFARRKVNKKLVGYTPHETTKITYFGMPVRISSIKDQVRIQLGVTQSRWVDQTLRSDILKNLRTILSTSCMVSSTTHDESSIILTITHPNAGINHYNPEELDEPVKAEPTIIEQLQAKVEERRLNKAEVDKQLAEFKSKIEQLETQSGWIVSDIDVLLKAIKVMSVS